MDRDAVLSSVFTPVRAATTFEETVERLGTAIRTGILPPGSRLPAERMLADELEISRSTLRQALTTLVQSGLLISLRGRGGGTFVTESPPLAPAGEPLLGEDVWGVLDHRVAIETGATMLAGERAEPDDLDRLDALVERMLEVDHFDLYRRADIRFHVGLAEAARSPRLVSAMTEVQGRMSELITRLPHPPELLMHSNAQHRRLVWLLRERDTGRAVRLMREHIEGTEHILAGLLR
ncbi:MAG TPA: FCD domain-containing protein [Solirubrobacteraceae bacterium]|jgi:DNA-binding FadR family transcriptional regulator|nr:FCD domain-containing protein [Solirubrobacteraceae bacterium]